MNKTSYFIYILNLTLKKSIEMNTKKTLLFKKVLQREHTTFLLKLIK